MEIISNNKTEKNTVEVEFKVGAEQFEEEVQKTFLKKKNSITIAGFRKGKAPRKMIEKQYGEGVFYEDTVNGMYQKTVADVIEELKLDVIDMPNIEVTSVSKEEGVSFKASFTVKPEVNISDYKGLSVTKTVKTVTDENIEEELKEMAEKGARIVDIDNRAAEKGDTVVFDFDGYVDDVAFEGGKAEKYSLELGSGQFIPGFEDQIIGKSIDEDFDVNVTFPEDYNAEQLAGKAAVFKCRIHEIKSKELPAIDDDFAMDVSEFDTLEELKADIRKKLEEKAETDSKNALDDAVSDAVIAKLDAEIPAVMYDSRIDDMIRDWEYKNRYQGIKIDDFLKYTGTTMEQFRENFRPAAENQVKLRLCLEKVAELENITIDADALEEQYKKYAEEFKMEIDKVKAAIPAANLEKDMKVEKAFDFLKENANVTTA